MKTFLYFLSGLTVLPTGARLKELGLGYTLPTVEDAEKPLPFTSKPCASGPKGAAGLIFSSGPEAENVYSPEKQKWRAVLAADGSGPLSGAFVGVASDPWQRPGPEDLAHAANHGPARETTRRLAVANSDSLEGARWWL